MAENVEEKKATPREQLLIVSDRINNINATRETCLKLIQEGAIKIVSVAPVTEGAEPVSMDISGEIVSTILSPVVRVLEKRKEDFISLKENLLNTIEKELSESKEKPDSK